MTFSKKFFVVIMVMAVMVSLFSNTYASNLVNNKVKLFYPIDGIKFTTVEIKVPREFEKRVELFALKALFNNKNVPKEAFTEIPKGIEVNNVTVVNGSAKVDLSKEFLNKVTPNHNIPTILDTITRTLFEFSSINQINITFDGEKVSSVNEWVFNESFKRPVVLPVSNKTKKFNESLQGKTKNEILDMLKKPENLYMAMATTTYPKKVYLDAGHGGSDPGASGTYNGITYYEKNINLSITNAAKAKLEQFGYTVYMRRTSDTYTNYTQIAGLANATDATCFVSIHCNASTNSSVHGTEVYYPDHDSYSNPFPNRITTSTELASVVGSALNSWNLPYWGTNPKVGNYAVLNGTKMFAILVECGYLSNSGDLQYLIDTTNQVDVGESIAIGTMNFFFINGWH